LKKKKKKQQFAGSASEAMPHDTRSQMAYEDSSVQTGESA